MKNLTVTILSACIAACGMSQSEQSRIAKAACTELSATTEEQTIQRLRIINAARETLQQDAYLGGDSDIARYQRWGTCHQFITNSDDLLTETARREQAYTTLRSKAASEGKRVTAEYFTDNGDYLIAISDANNESLVLDTKTMAAFNGPANGRRVYSDRNEHFDVRTQRHYVNGEEEGPVFDWHPNGQLWIEANYVDGKLAGLMRAWHENGQLRYEANFVGGKWQGPARQWHENGQLWSEANYVDGELEGLVRNWDEDGSLFSEENYVGGILQ